MLDNLLTNEIKEEFYKDFEQVLINLLGSRKDILQEWKYNDDVHDFSSPIIVFQKNKVFTLYCRIIYKPQDDMVIFRFDCHWGLIKTTFAQTFRENDIFRLESHYKHNFILEMGNKIENFLMQTMYQVIQTDTYEKHLGLFVNKGE